MLPRRPFRYGLLAANARILKCVHIYDILVRTSIFTVQQVYVPVVAENYVVKLELGTGKGEEGGSIELCLWDTPGQEDYPRLRPLAYANADVILICFAIDDRTSLENVEEKAGVWHMMRRQFERGDVDH